MTIGCRSVRGTKPPPVDCRRQDGRPQIVGRSPWQIASSRFTPRQGSMTALIMVASTCSWRCRRRSWTSWASSTRYVPQQPGRRHRLGAHRPHSAASAPTTRSASSRRPAATCSPGSCPGVTLSMFVAISGDHHQRHRRHRPGHHQPASWAAGSTSGSAAVMDLVLAFPQLLMLLALSPVLIDRITALGVPPRQPVRRGLPDLRARASSAGRTSPASSAGRCCRCASASSSRRRESLGRASAADLVQGAAAQPVGADPRLHDADPAGEHLGGGGTQLPRRRDQGARPPTLGNILTDSVNFLRPDPLYFFLPGLFIFTLVLAFNLLGDGLRDALDPKVDRI